MSGRRTPVLRRSRARRLGAGLAASAVVSLALPLAGGATAAPASTSAPVAAASVRAADPEFAGYASTTTATPVRLEIFEPTIPIPAKPEAEFNIGYSAVVADSSTTRGRASLLWPGAAVGEGFKTIVENLGLPPEVSGPLGEQGYPVQVNSNHPAGPASQSDEQFPGSIQRTSASAEKTTAAAGYSTDCRLGQPGEAPADGEGGEGGEGGEEGPIPGLPGLPGLPIPGLDGLSGLTTTVTSGLGDGLGSLTGALGGKGDRAEEEEVACPIPAQLALLIDVGGMGATSTVTRGEGEDGIERVRAVSRSALGEVSLLGGVITLDGVVSTATATSDGAKATVRGVTDYGTLTIAGQKFRFGSDGFEAAGQGQDLPGLPADPNQALEALGIQLLLPQPTEERDGDQGSVAVGGLQIVIDAGVLRRQLDVLPIDQISEAISGLPFPEEAAQLKSLLGAALNLAPKFVITLGNASSAVDTSPEIEIPDVDPGETDNGQNGPVSTGGPSGGSGGLPGAPGGGAPVDAPAAAGGGEPAIGDGALTDAAPAGAGLPELFSIPGAIFFGAIIGATVLGSYLRRLGVMALGGGAACAHGLQSGLPDLRKA